MSMACNHIEMPRFDDPNSSRFRNLMDHMILILHSIGINVLVGANTEEEVTDQGLQERLNALRATQS
jgi:hypothetical protein